MNTTNKNNIKQLLNSGIGEYLDIRDEQFESSINNKKEFSDNNIDNRHKDIYCLEPQQRFLSNYINPLTQYNSLLVYHSVGVGKTLTAISIAEKFKDKYKILILTKNNNLEFNFRNQLLTSCSNYIKNKEEYLDYFNLKGSKNREFKNKIDKEINKNYTFLTYNYIINNKNINLNNTLLIIDEVHNIINNSVSTELQRIIKRSSNLKLVFLSATPIYDNILEIFELGYLLNLNSNNNDNEIHYRRTSLLNNNFIKYDTGLDNNLIKEKIPYVTDQGGKYLETIFKGKISYLIQDTKSSSKLFPKKIYVGTPITNEKGSINIYKCKISEYQEKIYNISKKSENNVLYNVSSNVLTLVYPDGTYGKNGYIKNILKNRNKDFLKFENILKYSSKFYHLLKNLQSDKGCGFIYSNYVNYAGIALIKELLLHNGYSFFGNNNLKPKFVILDENLTTANKFRILKLFNHKSNVDGDIIKLIIGSPLISEGITFKNIRHIHILEPYWNFSRIDQIIGRGVRLNSHSMLPDEERYTKIYLYTAITRKKEESIDYMKYVLSEQKDRSNKEIEYILKKIAIDCRLNKSRNKLKSSENYSRDCQYKKCDFDCNYIISKKIHNDKSTYFLNKHDTELREYIKNKIKELYKIGYVYDLDHIVNYIKKSTEYNIDNENIYLVLDDIIKSETILENDLNIKGKIINVDKYYIISPKNNEDSELLFNKIYKKEKIYNNLNEIDLYKDVNNKKSESVKKVIAFTKKNNIMKSREIYGSYNDKFGIKDNKFRIIDYRNLNDNIVTGKVCTFFSKDELLDIAKHLKIIIPDKYSKVILCDKIEKELKSNKKIL